LRASLYGEENVTTSTENKTAPAVKGMEQDVPLRGIWGTNRSRLERCFQRFVQHSEAPVSHATAA